MGIEQIEGPRVAAASLQRFAAALLGAAGADEASAAATARAVVDASSRAFDTHGIRLLPFYLRSVQGGRVKGAPAITVTRKAPAVLHVDADDGFGHGASFRAVAEACAVAATAGIAIATVGRSSHHGATGCYTRAAALQGFVALGMTNTDACVVPHGGIDAFFGTNPLSIAVPVAGEDPMLLDMATSSIPLNRVLLRRATGTPLPPEVAVTAEGALTTDPEAAVALVPLGGATFGYKGAGLAAMVDVLCSALTDMPHGNTLEPLGEDFTRPIRIGHLFVVLAPALFQTLAAFDARVGAFLADLRGQRASGPVGVMAPGDLEKAAARERALRGIPIDPVTWAALAAAAEAASTPMPATL